MSHAFTGVSRTVALTLAATAVVLSPTGTAPARADHCAPVKVTDAHGEISYDVQHCHDSVTEGKDEVDAGDGGSTCELPKGYEFCLDDQVACWVNMPSAIPEERWPEETRPSPEAVYTYRYCRPDPDGTLTAWSWYEPDGPSLAERAERAFGQLRTPVFSVEFNPPRQAVVGLDTWFWVSTGTAGEIVGSEALGVRAVGTPDRLELDPGDGSGVVTCPWSAAQSAACSHRYERSSARETAAGPAGEPSYAVQMRLVYEVRFELDGDRLDLDGLPSSLESGWETVAVPVVEIQSIVARP